MRLFQKRDERPLTPFEKALRSAMPLAIALWGIGLWIVLACVACSAKPPGPLEKALQPTAAGRLEAALDATATQRGIVRRLYPPTACQTSTPLPYILPGRGEPKPGQEWSCVLLTSVAPPEPDQFAWVIVSLQPPAKGLPAELSPLGLRGCWLMVNPEIVLSVPPGFEALPGSMLTRDPGRGRIHFRWRPEAAHAGAQLWMQLLVWTPGQAPGDFLLSYAIEINVGRP